MKTAFSAAGAAILLLAVAAPAQEERPKIFLEKKVFADTYEGKKSFYEVHTVTKGENLWKILSRKIPVFEAAYSGLLKEFVRVNPGVTDPGKLKPGQRILLPTPVPPSQDYRVLAGKAVPHRVVRGDNLTKLLTTQGVPREELPRYLDAVKEINDSVRDVNRIVAGTTIFLPTEAYLAPAQEPPTATASAEPSPQEPPREEPGEPAAQGQKKGPTEPPAVALSRDVPSEPGPQVAEPARPEAQLRPPSQPQAAAPAIRTAPAPTSPEAAKQEELPSPSLKPPYRGLLTDLLAGLGEKWIDRGTLYLPVPSGGEVILNMEDYPVARFANGTHALIDFRGSLSPSIRELITGTWKNYRVVSLEGIRDAGEIIQRLLEVSGYHSVKEGTARPLVIGEGVSVTLPARWIVLRSPGSLLSGEVILIKEVPEKPSGNLAAILRYADRVGIRVLPIATDPSALEGFIVGIDAAAEDDPPRHAVPTAGLPALDFALDYLGIPKREGERLKIGGKGDAFQLFVAPERTFETGGKRYVVDTGKMTPALRTLVRDSGFAVFPVGRDEPGRSVFRRVIEEAGISSEPRREYLVAGGETEGYSVRATGTFLTSKAWLEGRKAGGVMLYGGRVHTATRILMGELGVEIVEW